MKAETNMKLILVDWSETFPELTSRQIVTLQSTYCMGCSKDIGIEKIGFIYCEACSKK